MGSWKELHDELAELMRAIDGLREACPAALAAQPRPPRELLEELTRRDAQARRHLSVATYSALPSPPPSPDMSCAQFWLRCMDLQDAVREYKRKMAPLDAKEGGEGAGRRP